MTNNTLTSSLKSFELNQIKDLKLTPELEDIRNILVSDYDAGIDFILDKLVWYGFENSKLSDDREVEKFFAVVLAKWLLEQ